MLQELTQLQERFEPYLLKGYYTFIAPVDQSLLEPFIKRVNNIAATIAISRSIHHALANKKAVHQVLSALPPDTPLKLVVVQAADNQVLLHDTVEGYCQKNNIDFRP